MRTKVIWALAILAAVMLVRNLRVILLHLPDDPEQGMIYRILFFHVPSWFTGGIAAVLATVASIMYLVRKDLRYDALAVSATEISLAFVCVGMVTGSIWARIIWGIWWTWDARLTSAFIWTMLYAAYLVLRTAIEDPTQRARISAVFSLFAAADLPIVWFSIEWFRTQHPQPVLRAGGYIDPAMKAAVYWNWPALMALAGVFLLIRIHQENTRREIDGLRRMAHAI
ncbi:MAG: cytochrome c biogenesis protein CcsA [Bryobacteraceae bacterium]